MGSAVIPEDLVDFIESGVAILVGTRDRELRPEATRGCGAVVSRDRRQLTVYLAEAWSKRALANIADNGEIAVGFSRPIDHFAIQVKGGRAVARDPAEPDRVAVERYKTVYCEQLYMVGIPRSITSRFAAWPARPVTFDVRELFVQTPGPNAGKRLGDR